MLPLFSSSHSLLPPPHIWTIGRTRFLCAATWAVGVFEGGAAPAVWIWFLQLCLLGCVLIFFKACTWLWFFLYMPAPSISGTKQRWTMRYSLFSPVCACAYVLHQLDLCWKYAQTAEHVCRWNILQLKMTSSPAGPGVGRPQPTLLLICSQQPPPPPAQGWG